MLRVAFVFQLILAPLVMGALVLAALLSPSLGSAPGVWLVVAAVLGFVVAIPLSIFAARSAPGMSL